MRRETRNVIETEPVGPYTLLRVERGEIELEGLHGSRVSFASGAVLFLCGLPLRLLRNRGAVPAVLSAISRPRR